MDTYFNQLPREMASVAFFFTSTPTRIPERMAATVACSMAFMTRMLTTLRARDCKRLPPVDVGDLAEGVVLIVSGDRHSPLADSGPQSLPLLCPTLLRKVVEPFVPRPTA